jgi:hypothetical protein
LWTNSVYCNNPSITNKKSSVRSKSNCNLHDQLSSRVELEEENSRSSNGVGAVDSGAAGRDHSVDLPTEILGDDDFVVLKLGVFDRQTGVERDIKRGAIGDRGSWCVFEGDGFSRRVRRGGDGESGECLDRERGVCGGAARDEGRGNSVDFIQAEGNLAKMLD